MVTIDNFNDVVRGIMQGAIDMHVHFGPESPPRPRLASVRGLDAVETARKARDAGMRAIVLKSHHYPTSPVAYVASQMVPGITLFGTLVLNNFVGGLNPIAVEIAAKFGTKVLFMPTLDAAAHPREGGRGEAISVLDERGKLLPTVHDILDIAKAYKMVLATGHLSPEEQLVLVEAARGKGVERIVVSHVPEEMPMELRKRLASLGAIIEHSFLACLPARTRTTPMAIVKAIQEVGAEHSSMTIDAGHVVDPEPAEAYRVFVAIMLDQGLSVREVELVAKINPARLLDLD